MTWRVITVDRQGRELTSAAVKTKDQALARACDLHRQGSVLSRIESNDGEEINAEDALAWGRANP